MRTCPQCRGTGVVDTPKYSRFPKELREFRQQYPKIPAEVFLCHKHGQYFDELDPLAPYHWEMSSCRKCRIEHEARQLLAAGKI